MSTTEPSHRNFCYRCFKPAVVCICDAVQPVDNHTHIEILQHPSERNHPIGTARFAMLGLRRVNLRIPYPDHSGSLTCPIPRLRNAGLLYPSPHAIPLSPSTSPTLFPQTLIVLDGTWSTAHKLYKENAWLTQLPHFTLAPKEPSRYRIRQEPAEHYVSTLEAIVAALHILEPQTDSSSLIAAFDKMIDRQMEYIESGEGRARRKRPRIREPKSIPKALRSQFEHIVLVYCENIRLENHHRLLVSCCAMRMGDGSIFEQFVDVPIHLHHRLNELEPSGILPLLAHHSITRDQFISAWKHFLRQGDILCAWNKGTLKSLFQSAGEQDHPYLFLKAAYGNIVKVRFGTLEDVVNHAQLIPRPMPFHGRAAWRMGNAAAVAEYLHRYKQ